MEPQEFTLTASDGAALACYCWPCEGARACIVLVHGMAEHARRYGRFAAAANAEDIAVLAMDLRGHGRSVRDGLKGWFARRDGWKLVLGDIHQLTEYARDAYTGLPVALVGHSMGSIFARAALCDFGGLYRCAVLSGVTVDIPGRRDVAPAIAGLCGLLQGRKKPSKLLDGLTFGAFNQAFEPSRTRFDWLSRDPDEVDKYIADEDCGFVCTASMFQDVSRVLLHSLRRSNIARMPKIPLFIVSGSQDPVGVNGEAALYLEHAYSAAGIPVRARVYEQARHELLNDTNRDEVTADILGFVLSSVQ